MKTDKTKKSSVIKKPENKSKRSLIKDESIRKVRAGRLIENTEITLPANKNITIIIDGKKSVITLKKPLTTRLNKRAPAKKSLSRIRKKIASSEYSVDQPGKTKKTKAD